LSCFFSHENRFELAYSQLELRFDSLHEGGWRAVTIGAAALDEKHRCSGGGVEFEQLDGALIDSQNGKNRRELIADLMLDIWLRTRAFAAKNAHQGKLEEGQSGRYGGVFTYLALI